MATRLYDLTDGVAVVTLNRPGPDADCAAHWRGRALALAAGPALACRSVRQALRASFDARFRGV